MHFCSTVRFWLSVTAFGYWLYSNSESINNFPLNINFLVLKIRGNKYVLHGFEFFIILARLILKKK